MEWIRGPTIGRGSSATVSLGTTSTSTSGDLFAVKSAELSCSSVLQREKGIISQLDSPYVVKYLGCDITCEQNKALYNLFLEYVPGGTLSDLVKRSRFSEPMIQFYAHQILLGIDYLHSKGLVHCDIKGQNILVSGDGSAIKIADLGCGKFLENGEAPCSAFSGTPAFMAPEVARGEEQGFPADIWAFGCTVIEMATGSAPWQDMNDPVSALYRIANSDDVPEFPRWFSDDAKEFLGKCLERDVKSRWTAAELLQHPFLQSLRSNTVTFKEFVRNSPTSVMDQGFWSSLEMSQTSCKSTVTAGFPANRIGRLIIEAGSSGPRLPDWEDDGGWMTVRGNQEDEDESIDLEPILFSILCPEELESSIVNEASSFDLFDDEISVNDRLSARTNAVASCENFRDAFVSGTQDFEEKIIKSSFYFKTLLSDSKFPTSCDCRVMQRSEKFKKFHIKTVLNRFLFKRLLYIITRSVVHTISMALSLTIVVVDQEC